MDMVDLLGLPSLRVVDVTATVADLHVTTQMVALPSCTMHPAAVPKPNGREGALQRIADTPMRGQVVRLTVQRHQYRCSVCDARLPTRGPDLDPFKAMTRRLIRYVENSILRRTAADVADETGLSERQVADIAKDFSTRIRSLQFETPDVVAMDGIWCSYARRFQIVTNGRTGQPLGIFEGLDAATAEQHLPTIIDPRAVRVFVTDMASENLSIGKTFPGAIHIADKWHVIERCNKAVRLVVGDEVAGLEKRGMKKRAAGLRELRARISGHRTAVEAKDPQFAFDLEKPPNPISRHARIVAAHRARWQLIEFYRSPSRIVAAERLAEFRQRATVDTIHERMADAVKYIDNHAHEILNYFDVLETLEDGTVWAATTNHAERKNSDLKRLWHQSRGFGQSDQFWLKGMFHSYHLGRHIIECGKCGRFEGPFGHQEVMDRASMPAMLVQDVRCSTCRL
jgi:transposase